MNSNSIGAINITDLSEQSKFQLDEVSKIENYFIEEINQENHAVKNYINMLQFLIIYIKF